MQRGHERGSRGDQRPMPQRNILPGASTPDRPLVPRTPPSGAVSARRLATLQGCANLSTAETEVITWESLDLHGEVQRYRRYRTPNGTRVSEELSPLPQRGSPAQRYLPTPPIWGTRGPGGASSSRVDQQQVPPNRQASGVTNNNNTPTIINIGCQITNNYYAGPNNPHNRQT